MGTADFPSLSSLAASRTAISPKLQVPTATAFLGPAACLDLVLTGRVTSGGVVSHSSAWSRGAAAGERGEVWAQATP